MSKLIIDIENDDELKEVKKVLISNGISFQSEEEYELEQRLKAKKNLASLISKLPVVNTQEEIESMVEEARQERYNREKNKNNY